MVSMHLSWIHEVVNRINCRYKGDTLFMTMCFGFVYSDVCLCFDILIQ